MCPISGITHRGAITKSLEKVLLNRKINKILHAKQKENNRFTKNDENK